MTDDRSLERAARSWLEAGPTEAPVRAVDAALLHIQNTRQDRVTPVLWRLPKMTVFARVFAGLATVVLVAVTGLVLLRPGGGPGAPTVGPSLSAGPSAGSSTAPTAAPSPSATVTPPVAACGLVTTREAAIYSPFGPGTGPTAAAAGTGSDPTTTCRYYSGDIALTLTYTKSGGKAAFDLVKATPGTSVISDLGADRGGGQLAADGVFDPAVRDLVRFEGRRPRGDPRRIRGPVVRESAGQ